MSAHQFAHYMEDCNMPDTGRARYIPAAVGFKEGWGTTVPADGTSGWAPGADFTDYDAAAGNHKWVNEGTATSCAFKRLEAVPLDLEDGENVAFGTNDNFTLGFDGTQLEILPATDDTGATNFGDGTTDADVKMFLGATTKYVLFDVGNALLTLEDVDLRMGNNDIIEFGDTADLTLSYVSASDALVLDPIASFVRMTGLSDRFGLKWVAGQRGKPGINGDIIEVAEATRMVTDPDFEVAGTNGSSDDVTFNAEGGITLTTDGADGDEVIIQPHQDANQSAWTQVTWGTDQETAWSCHVKTGASIGNCIIWAGLKTTNTEVTITDAEQAFFRYENGVNDGEWEAVSSIAGSDDSHDTGVVVAINTAYHLVIVIASDRTAKFYINGTLVETSGALTDATDLIPFIGVAADGAAEGKTLHVRGQEISRKFA